MNFFVVFIGAGLGGGARWWISTLISKNLPAVFPFGTLAVNVLGSFLLGFLIFNFDETSNMPDSVKLMLGTGFCGGFTTFSTFSYETMSLMRSGEIMLASGNILLNLLFTLAGVYLAYYLTR